MVSDWTVLRHLLLAFFSFKPSPEFRSLGLQVVMKASGIQLNRRAGMQVKRANREAFQHVSSMESLIVSAILLAMASCGSGVDGAGARSSQQNGVESVGATNVADAEIFPNYLGALDEALRADGSFSLGMAYSAKYSGASAISAEEELDAYHQAIEAESDPSVLQRLPSEDDDVMKGREGWARNLNGRVSRTPRYWALSGAEAGEYDHKEALRIEDEGVVVLQELHSSTLTSVACRWVGGGCAAYLQWGLQAEAELLGASDLSITTDEYVRAIDFGAGVIANAAHRMAWVRENFGGIDWKSPEPEDAPTSRYGRVSLLAYGDREDFLGAGFESYYLGVPFVLEIELSIEPERRLAFEWATDSGQVFYSEEHVLNADGSLKSFESEARTLFGGEVLHWQGVAPMPEAEEWLENEVESKLAPLSGSVGRLSPCALVEDSGSAKPEKRKRKTVRLDPEDSRIRFPNASGEGGGQVQFSGTFVDLGAVSQGSHVEIPIRVENIGSEDVEFLEVSASCSCSVATISASKIRASESQVIWVRQEIRDIGESTVQASFSIGCKGEQWDVPVAVRYVGVSDAPLSLEVFVGRLTPSQARLLPLPDHLAEVAMPFVGNSLDTSSGRSEIARAALTTSRIGSIERAALSVVASPERFGKLGARTLEFPVLVAGEGGLHAKEISVSLSLDLIPNDVDDWPRFRRFVDFSEVTSGSLLAEFFLPVPLTRASAHIQGLECEVREETGGSSLRVSVRDLALFQGAVASQVGNAQVSVLADSAIGPFRFLVYDVATF